MLKRQFKVVVTNSVLLEHHSRGKIDKSWMISALAFHRMYGKILPLNPLKVCNEKTLKKIEFKNGMLFCEKLLQYQLKKAAIFYWLILVKQKPWSKFHYRFLKKWLKFKK